MQFSNVYFRDNRSEHVARVAAALRGSAGDVLFSWSETAQSRPRQRPMTASAILAIIGAEIDPVPFVPRWSLGLMGPGKTASDNGPAAAAIRSTGPGTPNIDDAPSLDVDAARPDPQASSSSSPASLPLPPLPSGAWFPAPKSTAPMPDSAAASETPPLRLSFSSIDAYLTCPQRYNLLYMERVPPRVNGPMMAGSALHAAIARYLELLMETGERDPDVLRETLVASWRRGHYGTAAADAARLRELLGVLTAFHVREAAAGRVPVEVEHSFKVRFRDDDGRDAYLSGFIDRVDPVAPASDNALQREAVYVCCVTVFFFCVCVHVCVCVIWFLFFFFSSFFCFTVAKNTGIVS
jgi:hypothetical protein